MANTLYPARVVGTQLVHLARTEARSDDEHALYAICPGGTAMTAELELVPAEDAEGIVWCPDCKSYYNAVTPRERLDLEQRAERIEERDRIARLVELGNAHPTRPAPEGIWLE